jgi:hypothetical protein
MLAIFRKGNPMPKAPVAPPTHPPSTVEVTSIEAIGHDKVAITLKMEVDVHRTVEVGGEMLSVAIKEVNSHNAQAPKAPKTLRAG